MPPPKPGPSREVDLEGTYRMRASFSVGVVVAYAILIALVLAVVAPRVQHGYTWVTYLLVGLLLLFLARYLSTSYTLNDTHLHAWTILGGVRVPLDEVRAIEYASLRDLSPTGGWLASWVMRGKMYSPVIGEFDMVFTEAASGVLVTAGPYPLYISPRRPEEFARELSRRVRSYTGPLLKDVGNPVQSGPAV
jgi:hypothetical protein